MERCRRYLTRGVLVCLAGGLGAAILYWTGIGCVWRYFLHINCPGCGMTRAVICALKGDFAGAFSYHFMFWSLPLLVLLIVFDGKLFRRKWMNYALMGVIALGFLVNYLVHYGI